jgi:homogentisate 1,2-dioxygenase
MAQQAQENTQQDIMLGKAHPKPAARTEAAPAYQSGFGNQIDTEPVAGARPPGRNTEQRPPQGLSADWIARPGFTMTLRGDRHLDLSHPSLGGARPYKRVDNG